MQAENFRKLLAMSEDVRVLLIKPLTVHTICNYFAYFKTEKRARIARETLEIYAPLAERIGVTNLQKTLEATAFCVI